MRCECEVLRGGGGVVVVGLGAAYHGLCPEHGTGGHCITLHCILQLVILCERRNRRQNAAVEIPQRAGVGSIWTLPNWLKTSVRTRSPSLSMSIYAHLPVNLI